jgi:hypothetical protein
MQSTIEYVIFQFQFIPWYVFAGGAVVAAALSWWAYYNTAPKVTGWLRALLIVLRATALLLILVGIADIVLELGLRITHEAKVAVAVDTSSSIAAPTDSGRAEDALNTIRTLRGIYGSHLRMYTFDESAREFAGGGITFEGNATDIAGALEKIAENRHTAAAVLVTDGRDNIGQDPRTMQLGRDIPVHAVAVGRQPDVSDVVVNRVSAPKVGYNGADAPVEAYISSAGTQDAEATVTVSEDGRVIASRSVSVSPDALSRVEFDIPLRGIGSHTYTVAADTPYNEPTYNNERAFVVEVLKSKFRILVITDAPSPDFVYLRSIIDESESFDGVYVSGLNLRGSGLSDYPETLGEFEAVAILDNGGVAMTQQRARDVMQFVRNGNGLLTAGSTPPEQGELRDGLPVTFRAAPSSDVTFSPLMLTEQGRRHFITVGSPGSRLPEMWEMLPPASSAAPAALTGNTGVVLAEAVMQENGARIAALSIGKNGSGRVAVFPVSGFWRFPLMLESMGEGRGVFDTVMVRLLRWLTSAQQSSMLSVTTDARTYLSGETVFFDGRLYDDVYTPISGAKISVTLDNDPSRRILLEETSPAVYSGEFHSVGTGSHIYSAEAHLDGELIAETEGEFDVQEFSIEMLDPSPDHALLATLTENHGGIMVSPGGLDSLAALVEPGETIERREEGLAVTRNPFLPGLAIALLAIEWILRKQRGLL